LEILLLYCFKLERKWNLKRRRGDFNALSWLTLKKKLKEFLRFKGEKSMNLQVLRRIRWISTIKRGIFGWIFGLREIAWRHLRGFFVLISYRIHKFTCHFDNTWKNNTRHQRQWKTKAKIPLAIETSIRWTSKCQGRNPNDSNDLIYFIFLRF
jgi:hypothetical protein